MTNSNVTQEMKINKSCFDIFPTLESEKLIYREINSKDVEDIFKIYNDPEVAKYDWYNPIATKDNALSIINRYRNEFQGKEEITWGVARKNDNKIIGYCCLGDFDDDSRRSEIGYGFNRHEWSKGYATEAIKTLVKFGFEVMGLNRIEAIVTLGNAGSVKALKKANFTQEGIVRERTLMKGEFVDDVILSIIKRDYIMKYRHLKNNTENLFEDYEQNHYFSGVGFVKIKDEIIYGGAKGYAHKGYKIENTLTTKFDTASITKLFTTVAILQLVDSGKLNLSDRILNIIDIGETTIPNEVTIYHLLTHTSGIADDADEEANEDYEDIWKDKPCYATRETADFLPNFIHKEPNFKPGEGHRYNNVGFILLGLAIEKITGVKYMDYIVKNIFKVANMANTEFCYFDGIFENVAEGYGMIENENEEFVGWRKNIFSYPPIGSPYSGAYTTVEDLDKFIHALKDGHLLSPKLTKEIFKDQILVEDNEIVRYIQCYGFDSFFNKKYASLSYCKDGINVGVANILKYYPENDMTIAIMSNQEANIWKMCSDIQDIIFENK
ncbi:GNAT family N-acetyltransferase [Clostridium algidicarnis]|uniref:GNAT family N-acetyltransferase n=1 Tax=Clostridium algidicarnis TaxID=37659 RepID=UPI001C0D5EA6|nr:GNAT family N-acetyltransferase [Clostridium algidicarnis]MBU3209490.1 GNAT family N-acetyltransferase [Clostridium algidicarnis]